MQQLDFKIIRDFSLSSVKYIKYLYMRVSTVSSEIFIDPLTQILQSRKTSYLRGFIFSNYQNLNNGNLLSQSCENDKKWPKTTKNGMLKLTYIKAL